MKNAIKTNEKISINEKINNYNRTVGSILSSEITKAYGEKGLSENTLLSYRNDLNNAANIIKSKKLSDIDDNDLMKIISKWSKNFSVKSQNRMMSSLKQFFIWLKLENHRSDTRPLCRAGRGISQKNVS